MLGGTGSAGSPWFHSPGLGVVVEWACVLPTCGLRVRLQGLEKHFMHLTERHTRLGPSPSSGHAWLETRLKCPFTAKGKNAQAEPEAETPRQRRRGTGRCHHPAAPPALPGDTCSSYLTLSCRIPSGRRSGILKLSPKVSVRGADCGMCGYPGPRPETAIAKRYPQPWLSYSKLS